jgi:hypothetical protein
LRDCGQRFGSESGLPGCELGPQIDYLIEGMPSTASARRCAASSSRVGITSGTTPGQYRSADDAAKPNRGNSYGPASLHRPAPEVGGHCGLFEVIPLRTFDFEERCARADEGRELGAQRSGPEERPVDRKELPRSQEQVAPEGVVVAQDLREQVKGGEQTLAVRPEIQQLATQIGRIHAADQRLAAVARQLVDRCGPFASHERSQSRLSHSTVGRPRCAR